MIAARAGVGDRHIDVAGQRALNAQVELHDVGRLQIEVDRLQLRADRRVRVEPLRDDRKWRIVDRSARREWRVETAREEIVLRQNLVVKESEARAHRRLSAAERGPRHAETRREVFEWRGVLPGIPDRELAITHVTQI